MTDHDLRPSSPRALLVMLGSLLVDATAIGGAGSITVGAWQIFHPAAFIVGGAFLLTAAWLAARRGA